MLVYVQVIEEASVAPYRPTMAEEISPGVVRLPSKPHDPGAEVWEFPPGSVVRVAYRMFKDGDSSIVILPVALTTVDPELHRCRVCGVRIADFVPWEELRKQPGHSSCPCCGVQWGTVDTFDISCRRFRMAWIEKGAPWFQADKKPKGWSLEEQLQHVPQSFR